MTKPQLVLQLARISLAVLTLVAIGIQLNIHLGEGFGALNFFSYFTNLSNILASITLLIAAGVSLSGKTSTPKLDFLRGLSVVQMLLVGVVFNTLLLNVDLGSLLPWINNVVHRLMPLFILLDWLVQPPVYRLQKTSIYTWLIFPTIYLIYSVVRGAMILWYAYPFFDPTKVGGGQGVAMYCAAMLVGLVLMAVFVYWVGNRRSGNESKPSS